MNHMEYVQHYDSPLGRMTLAADGEALTGLDFDGRNADTPAAGRDGKNLPVFDQARRWLDIYFSGKAPDFTPRLATRGTDFREAVWQILLTIPFGQTMTYGAIAEKMAKQLALPHMSAQAVGGAVGHNAISIIIPCHRVVGANGSLTGYAGGIDKKIRLLTLEQADMSGLFVPKRSTAA